MTNDLQFPYVMAALVCQNVKENPDQSITIFGACSELTRKEIKRGTMPPLGPAALDAGADDRLYLFIAVAFEELAEHTLGFRFLAPDQSEIVSSEEILSVPDYGKTTGRICTAAFGIDPLPIPKGGKYWFEILADHQPVTRVPLRVKIVWAD